MIYRFRAQPEEPKGKHYTRDLIRKSSVVNSNIRTSLQPCTDPDLLVQKLSVLEQKNKKVERYVRKITGLQRILMHLMIPGKHGQYMGVIEFSEAHELYNSYHPHPTNIDEFRDTILHPDHGLCVHIVYIQSSQQRLIVLKAKGDVCHLLEILTSPNPDNTVKENPQKDIVQDTLELMTSEWDRNCGRMLYSLGKPNNDLIKVGIHPIINNSNMDKIADVSTEVKNTSIAALDMVKLRINHKTTKLQEEISDIDNKLEKHRNAWSQLRLTELEERKTYLNERLARIQDLSAQNDDKSKQRFRQMLKRTATSLAEENRLKRRKLGAGAHRKLDSEDEEFIAKSIEDKACYHGRRHDTVMYTNRRVKVRDLMNIANHSLTRRGKKHIKSAITAWNRLRPRNKRSRQAKLHIGKGLFCTKKPPKAEDKDNVNTHHQRAHIKNIQMKLFESVDSAKWAYIHSMDDKAYVRPGTSEGFEKSRRVRILSVTGNNAKQLPKYDWPEKLVYQTPAAHRIMTKKRTEIDGKPVLHTEVDRHNIFVRPKAIVDSSGTTWASERVRLRHEQPDTFEVDVGGFKTHATVRKYVSSVHDSIYLYHDMTVESDYMKVEQSLDCQYRKYERRRVDDLIKKLQRAKDNIAMHGK